MAMIGSVSGGAAKIVHVLVLAVSLTGCGLPWAIYGAHQTSTFKEGFGGLRGGMSAAQVEALIGAPHRKTFKEQTEEWHYRTYTELWRYHLVSVLTLGAFYVVPPTIRRWESHKVVLWKGIAVSYGPDQALSPMMSSAVAPEIPILQARTYRVAQAITVREQKLVAALRSGLDVAGWRESAEAEVVVLFNEQTGSQVVHVPPQVVWRQVSVQVPGQSISGSIQTDRGTSTYQGSTSPSSTSVSVPVTVPGYDMTMTAKTLGVYAFMPSGRHLWEGYCTWDTSQFVQDPGEIFIGIFGFSLGRELAPAK